MTRIAATVVRMWPVVLGAWAVLLAVTVVFGPDFSEEATFDDAAFLPPGSSTARGEQLVMDGWPDDSFINNAAVAVTRDDRPLGDDDADWVLDLVEWLERSEPGALGEVTTHLRDEQVEDQLASEDGHAWLVVVGLDAPPYSPNAQETVRTLRERIADQPPPADADALVTGTAAVALDEDEAIDASVQRTQILTVVLVLGLLLYIFRSPVAALVPLVTVGAAYTVAVALVGVLASAGMEVSYLFETFAIVIVFGAGTDYSLLALSRYDEELAGGVIGTGAGGALDPTRRPVVLTATLAVLGGVIASSAASTIVGFSAQSVARFGLFRTMGPALAISIAVTLVAGLTLTPALMRAAGRWLYWPRMPEHDLPEATLPPPPDEEPAESIRPDDLPTQDASGQR